MSIDNIYNVSRLPAAFLARTSVHPLICHRFANIDKDKYDGMLGNIFMAVMGGVPLDVSRICSAHRNVRAVTREEGDAWLGCLRQALDDIGFESAGKEAFLGAISAILDTMLSLPPPVDIQRLVDRLIVDYDQDVDIAHDLRVLQLAVTERPWPRRPTTGRPRTTACRRH
jgi:truncated hemoglobin YjbI